MENQEQFTKNKPEGIGKIIVVASGKGGVGKSTVAAGLAMTLASEGHSVGLLDADIYGPSIPLLFNLKGKRPFVIDKEGKTFLVPFIQFGIKLMSIGFLIDTKEPVIWRGPKASSGLSQLLNDTLWGELDYLVIDTPPGTGDIHITILQNMAADGVIFVTTPQDMAMEDVKKAIAMYKNKQIGIPVLGIVENMSWFTPSNHPEEKYFVFGKGGGERLSKEFDIPLLVQIPVNEKVGESCDAGKMNELLLDKQIYDAFLKLGEVITK
jgi:ATP-binding protein involved in chromosome partitioning